MGERRGEQTRKLESRVRFPALSNGAFKAFESLQGGNETKPQQE